MADHWTKEQWLTEGDRHYVLNHYQEALAAYEEALRLDPAAAVAYRKKAAALSNLERHEEAFAATEQALHLDPHHAEACYQKGYTLFILQRYHEALAAIKQAVRLAPDNPALRLGEQLLQLYLTRSLDAR